MNKIATLLIGSALGSSILGVLFALTYLRKRGLRDVLKVNVNFASAPARFFFRNYYHQPSLIEIIDLKTGMKDVLGTSHPATIDLEGDELFFSPHIPGYDYCSADFELLSSVFEEFREGIQYASHVGTFDVCAHIRRGDKLIYEKSNKVNAIEEYLFEIDRRIQSDSRICILTDDYNTYLEVKNLRPDWDVRTTSSPLDIGFNISEINEAAEHVVQWEVDRMLDDYERIRRCVFFIGTQASNVGYLARLLRRGSNLRLLN